MFVLRNSRCKWTGPRHMLSFYDSHICARIGKLILRDRMHFVNSSTGLPGHPWQMLWHIWSLGDWRYHADCFSWEMLRSHLVYWHQGHGGDRWSQIRALARHRCYNGWPVSARYAFNSIILRYGNQKVHQYVLCVPDIELWKPVIPTWLKLGRIQVEDTRHCLVIRRQIVYFSNLPRHCTKVVPIPQSVYTWRQCTWNAFVVGLSLSW